ncbi:MAG: hypothetical protein D6705_15000 [Deltaproteobacteria bacterium]|nr:MAG: hypothetical protein D6705_15000 [Deltaproteobacteria bacterium]
MATKMAPSEAIPWTHLFPEATEQVETHISRVFLAPSEVFKVKKSVDYGFLDFRTLEARQRACRAEVELGRRLAPDAYLGVVALVRDAGGAWRRVPVEALEDDAEVVDVAVHMRRLPDDDRADVRLAQGRLSPSDVDRVAGVLAAFFGRARRTVVYGDPRFVRYNVDENFRQTERTIGDFLSPEDVARLRRYQYGRLMELSPLLAERARCGRAVEGHGDLRLEHVYLDEGGTVRILDCIEFNERFRCGDVASDLAFLSMDLTYRGRYDLAERLLARYAEASADFGIYRLVDFFESYRAHVRAKVETFVRDAPGVDARRRQQAAERARRYYLLACSAGRAGLTAPFVVAVTGPMGIGKTTVARAVADRYGAPVIGTDPTRKQLLGVDPTAPLLDAPHEGAYDPLVTDVVYDEVLARADEVLASGRPVVVDGTFGSAGRRDALVRLAARHGVRMLLVFGRLDPDERARRLRRRTEGPSVSDGRPAIAPALDAAFEPPDELPADVRLDVDMARDPADNAERIVAALGIRPLAPEVP